MRILYLGLPLGVDVLLRAGHVPVACAIGHPEAPGMARLRRRLPMGTLLLGRPRLEDPHVQRALESTGFDVLLSWFWPRKIPASLLLEAPLGAYGVHPSLLPRWRGPDPYFHTILHGDAETGVTLHRLEPEYDTGAVVARSTLRVHPQDTGWSLARRLDRPSLALLVGCADALASGVTPASSPQDDALATAAPRPDEDDLALAFTTSDAAQLERCVRAAAPEPGASALLEDTFVTVLQADVWRGRFPGGLRAGEAFVAPEGVVVRAARGGGLCLRRVRTDDDQVLEGHEIAALVTPRR